MRKLSGSSIVWHTVQTTTKVTLLLQSYMVYRGFSIDVREGGITCFTKYYKQNYTKTFYKCKTSSLKHYILNPCSVKGINSCVRVWTELLKIPDFTNTSFSDVTFKAGGVLSSRLLDIWVLLREFTKVLCISALYPAHLQCVEQWTTSIVIMWYQEVYQKREGDNI